VIRVAFLLVAVACAGERHEPAVKRVEAVHPGHAHPHLHPHEWGGHHHHPHPHPHLAGPEGHHHPY